MNFIDSIFKSGNKFLVVPSTVAKAHSGTHRTCPRSILSWLSYDNKKSWPKTFLSALILFPRYPVTLTDLATVAHLFILIVGSVQERSRYFKADVLKKIPCKPRLQFCQLLVLLCTARLKTEDILVLNMKWIVEIRICLSDLLGIVFTFWNFMMTSSILSSAFLIVKQFLDLSC